MFICDRPNGDARHASILRSSKKDCRSAFGAKEILKIAAERSPPDEKLGRALNKDLIVGIVRRQAKRRSRSSLTRYAMACHDGGSWTRYTDLQLAALASCFHLHLLIEALLRSSQVVERTSATGKCIHKLTLVYACGAGTTNRS